MAIKFYKTSVDLQVIESIKDDINKLNPNGIKKFKSLIDPSEIELEDLILFFFLNLPVKQFEKNLQEMFPEISLNRMEKEKLLQIISNNKHFHHFMSVKQYVDSDEESTFVQKLLVPKIYDSLTESDKKTYSQALIYIYIRFCPIEFVTE